MFLPKNAFETESRWSVPAFRLIERLEVVASHGIPSNVALPAGPKAGFGAAASTGLANGRPPGRMN